jgi:hypothetical protein
MQTERCDTCRFWKKDPEDEREGVGECHRMPPQMIADSDYLLSIGDTSSPITGFFPETLHWEWCGEWQPEAKGGI